MTFPMPLFAPNTFIDRVVALVDHGAGSGSGATRTFAAADLGETGAKRRIYVCFTMEGNSITPTGMTLGGVAMTLVGNATETRPTPDTNAAMFYIDDATSTTADIVITFNDSESGNSYFSVISVRGGSSRNQTDTDQGTESLASLTIPTDGIGLSVHAINTSAGTTPNNCTELLDVAVGSDGHWVGYYDGVAGAVTFGPATTVNSSFAAAALT